MTDREKINCLRIPNRENPLRMLMSACLTGITCGYDGSANGVYPSALKFLTYDTARITRFCPEEFAFGSPREMCDIHGGNGMDVLDGKARVLTESGKDWSADMIRASEKMLELARQEDIEIAVMMDISAACGSQVIYEGNRFAENKTYQIGTGVSAALLIRHGFTVISQRDFASLDLLYAKLDPHHILQPELRDHHETDWYQTYFKH